jgi:hypothetical protein
MDYKTVLEMAGAKVICFKKFGSYQGDWWAKVDFNGIISWVHGWYGSCSGCDTIDAISSSHPWDVEDDHFLYGIGELKNDCPDCQKIKQQFLDVGTNYLNDLHTQEEAENLADRDLEWDLDAHEMLKFIKENA